MPFVFPPVTDQLTGPLAFAVNCTDCVSSTQAEVGVTVTKAGGGSVTVAESLRPASEAVIVAVPAAMPVTVPRVETMAMAGLALDQVTGCPVTTPLPTSRPIAASVTLPPTRRVSAAADSSTLAIGSRTATRAESTRPVAVRA